MPAATILKFSAKVLVVAAIFYLLHSSGHLDLVKLGLLINQPALGLALFGVLSLAMIVPSAVRWWLLLKAMGVEVPWRKVNSANWIGLFFSVFLPSALGGDVVKGVYLHSFGQRQKSVIAMSLLVDRILGLAGLMAISFVSLFFVTVHVGEGLDLFFLKLLVTGTFLGLAFFMAVSVFPRSGGRFSLIRQLEKFPRLEILLKLYRAFRELRNAKGLVGLAFLISVWIHLAATTCFYVILRALNTPLPVSDLMLAVPLGELSTAIPIAPVGIGIGHAAYAYLFHLFGNGQGANAFNLFTVVRLLASAAGGFFYLTSHRVRDR